MLGDRWLSLQVQFNWVRCCLHCGPRSCDGAIRSADRETNQPPRTQAALQVGIHSRCWHHEATGNNPARRNMKYCAQTDRRLALAWQERQRMSCSLSTPRESKAAHSHIKATHSQSAPNTHTHPGRGWRTPTACPPLWSWLLRGLGRGHGWAWLPARSICCLLLWAGQWESLQARLSTWFCTWGHHQSTNSFGDNLEHELNYREIWLLCQTICLLANSFSLGLFSYLASL